jgi:hypothetical protein
MGGVKVEMFCRDHAPKAVCGSANEGLIVGVVREMEDAVCAIANKSRIQLRDYFSLNTHINNKEIDFIPTSQITLHRCAVRIHVILTPSRQCYAHVHYIGSDNKAICMFHIPDSDNMVAHLITMLTMN